MKTRQDLENEVLRNKQHIYDLQLRLDNVASKAKAKGKRKPIGSTMPYSVVRERELKLNKEMTEKQFGKFVRPATGKSYQYLIHGCYLDR